MSKAALVLANSCKFVSTSRQVLSQSPFYLFILVLSIGEMQHLNAISCSSKGRQHGGLQTPPAMPCGSWTLRLCSSLPVTFLLQAHCKLEGLFCSSFRFIARVLVTQDTKEIYLTKWVCRCIQKAIVRFRAFGLDIHEYLSVFLITEVLRHSHSDSSRLR